MSKGIRVLEALALTTVEPVFDLRDLSPAQHAEEPAAPERPKAWTRAVKRREIAFQALNAIDLAQTIHCIHIAERCHEANPLWGEHPSVEKLVAIKLGSAALHYFVTDHLARRDPEAAAIFQWATIGIQGGVVTYNFSVIF